MAKFLSALVATLLAVTGCSVAGATDPLTRVREAYGKRPGVVSVTVDARRQESPELTWRATVVHSGPLTTDQKLAEVAAFFDLVAAAKPDGRMTGVQFRFGSQDLFLDARDPAGLVAVVTGWLDAQFGGDPYEARLTGTGDVAVAATTPRTADLDSLIARSRALQSSAPSLTSLALDLTGSPTSRLVVPSPLDAADKALIDAVATLTRGKGQQVTLVLTAARTQVALAGPEDQALVRQLADLIRPLGRPFDVVGWNAAKTARYLTISS